MQAPVYRRVTYLAGDTQLVAAREEDDRAFHYFVYALLAACIFPRPDIKYVELFQPQAAESLLIVGGKRFGFMGRYRDEDKPLTFLRPAHYFLQDDRLTLLLLVPA